VFDRTALRSRITGWLNDRPDDSVLQWTFRSMIGVTAIMLVLDFVDLHARGSAPVSSIPAVAPQAAPDVTKTVPDLPARREADRRRTPMLRPDARLAQPMTFDLLADGRLLAVGTIQPGTAKTFQAEVEKRGGYVKTVVLHSPGGSVQDALAMGRLIRQKNFATEVENGTYCASSCPLVFAGGAERRAADKAAIGVHQVTTIGRDGAAVAESTDGIQRVSAECQRYLHEMGIDPLVWVHAMETPSATLYTFRIDELLALKLATHRNGVPAAATAGSPQKS
jgi:hypothetical protein